MTITTEELASIRAIAEADKNGADGKAWDEAITPDIVIALCDRIEEQQDALRLLDMELSAVRNALEATELEAYLLEQSNLWIAAVAFDGTASDYGSLYGLVEAAHEAVRGRQMNEHALNGLDAGLEQRQWEIGVPAGMVARQQILGECSPRRQCVWRPQPDSNTLCMRNLI